MIRELFAAYDSGLRYAFTDDFGNSVVDELNWWLYGEWAQEESKSCAH